MKTCCTKCVSFCPFPQAKSLNAQFAEENKTYDTIETVSINNSKLLFYKCIFSLSKSVMCCKQPEAKETGHTPEIMGQGSTKDDLVTKKSERMKPQMCKLQSQDTLLSETSCYMQKAYSKSTVQTITSKSTVERKEQTHTSFLHTHTFNVSSSPVERDRSISALQQNKRSSQDDTPPAQGECHTASHCSEFQKAEKQTAGLRGHHEKFQGVSGSHTAAHTLHADVKVFVNLISPFIP